MSARLRGTRVPKALGGRSPWSTRSAPVCTRPRTSSKDWSQWRPLEAESLLRRHSRKPNPVRFRELFCASGNPLMQNMPAAPEQVRMNLSRHPQSRGRSSSSSSHRPGGPSLRSGRGQKIGPWSRAHEQVHHHPYITTPAAGARWPKSRQGAAIKGHWCQQKNCHPIHFIDTTISAGRLQRCQLHLKAGGWKEGFSNQRASATTTHHLRSASVARSLRHQEI